MQLNIPHELQGKISMLNQPCKYLITAGESAFEIKVTRIWDVTFRQAKFSIEQAHEEPMNNKKRSSFRANSSPTDL